MMEEEGEYVGAMMRSRGVGNWRMITVTALRLDS